MKLLKPVSVALAFVLLLGFFVRSSWSEYGLPYEIVWDEPQITQPVARLLRHGIYKPEAFDYGPMNVYIHSAWGAVSFIRGLGRGAFPDSIWGVETDLQTGWYWSVPSPWLLSQARIFCALMGVLACWLVYRAARILISPTAGVFAAAAVAFLNTSVSQTSLLTSDAIAIAASAGCLLGTAVFWRTGSSRAVIGAALAAALSASLKYNSVSVILLPLLAVLLRPAPAEGDSSRSWRPGSLVVLSVFGGALALFLLPAFFNVPDFLHNIANVLGFYKSGERATSALSHLHRYVQQMLSLMDCGNFRGAGNFDFYFLPAGLGVLALLVGGTVAAARRDLRLTAVLLVSVLATVVLVGGDIRNFFVRYLVYAIIPLAVLIGAGGEALVSAVARILARRPGASGAGRAAGALLASLLFLPITVNAMREASNARSLVETRVQLSRKMLESVPSGARILIFKETRWSPTPEEEKKFRIAYTTIPRASLSLSDGSQFDYAVTPAAVEYATDDPHRTRMVEEMNAWLKNFSGMPMFQTGGKQPVYFGRPTGMPGVRLWKSSQFAAKETRIPEDFVYGIAFESGRNPRDARLGDGVLAVPTEVPMFAPLRLTKPVTQAVVKAKGRNPEPGAAVPEIALNVYHTTDTLTATPIYTGNFWMSRARSGLLEYSLPVNLPPADYVISLRAIERANQLTFIEWLRFE